MVTRLTCFKKYRRSLDQMSWRNRLTSNLRSAPCNSCKIGSTFCTIMRDNKESQDKSFFCKFMKWEHKSLKSLQTLVGSGCKVTRKLKCSICILNSPKWISTSFCRFLTLFAGKKLSQSLIKCLNLWNQRIWSMSCTAGFLKNWKSSKRVSKCTRTRWIRF